MFQGAPISATRLTAQGGNTNSPPISNLESESEPEMKQAIKALCAMIAFLAFGISAQAANYDWVTQDVTITSPLLINSIALPSHVAGHAIVHVSVTVPALTGSETADIALATTATATASPAQRVRFIPYVPSSCSGPARTDARRHAAVPLTTRATMLAQIGRFVPVGGAVSEGASRVPETGGRDRALRRSARPASTFAWGSCGAGGGIRTRTPEGISF